jgi:uncharacterized protein (TIGR03435 family)
LGFDGGDETGGRDLGVAKRARTPVALRKGLASVVLLGAVMSAAPPAFEVASVKVNPDPPRKFFGAIQRSPDSLTMRGISLWLGVRWAYGVESFQISGPEWLQAPPFYDILAKAPGAVRESEMRWMFRTLLAERFHLAVHWEKREMPVMALVVAKGGPKFRESVGKYDPQRGAEAPMQFLGFASSVHIQRSFDQGRVRDSFTNMPMKDFASVLAMWASRSPYEKVAVVDMTGLAGRFDFAIVMDRPGSAEGGEASLPDDPLGAIERVLPKELGLALQRRKASVDVLVIDHADRNPTPN